jgi:hypothetical protein
MFPVRERIDGAKEKSKGESKLEKQQDTKVPYTYRGRESAKAGCASVENPGGVSHGLDAEP